MIIHIDVNELLGEFKERWRLGLIKSLSIDYATNAIHGWFEEEEVIIFTFKNYGFIIDNKYNSYYISSGSAGITIKIETGVSNNNK
jgi:hypothetical protein|tara:strand:- start:17 stop:274 length:258 start_codon:yes stop_codon:yes gene_type:complete